MRAVDGVVVVVDPVEGIMPQTETVAATGPAGRRPRPVLFVNKVDRLLTELRLTPEQTFERLLKLIADVDRLINNYAPEEFVGKWNVSVEDGSVCIGSAAKKWAISKRMMEKYNTSFKQMRAHRRRRPRQASGGRADRRGLVRGGGGQPAARRRASAL